MKESRVLKPPPRVQTSTGSKNKPVEAEVEIQPAEPEEREKAIKARRAAAKTKSPGKQ